MKCAKCGHDLAEEQALPGGYCRTCFFEIARERKSLTPEERKRLMRAVKEEMAGVLPREALRGILEECCQAMLMGKEDADEVLNRTLSRLDQLAGLSMCEEILGVLGALQTVLREQEALIRDKVKKLADL